MKPSPIVTSFFFHGIPTALKDAGGIILPLVAGAVRIQSIFGGEKTNPSKLFFKFQVNEIMSYPDPTPPPGTDTDIDTEKEATSRLRPRFES